MIKTGMITGVSLKANSTPSPCRPCIIAKAKRLPVNKIRSKPISKSFGDLIYSDVWGPATMQTIGHARYFVLFIDNKTQWITAEQMTSKSLVFTKYCHYEAWAKTQFGVTIKSLQSDNSGEYTSTEFKNHCKAQGTTHHFAVHEVHKHNGVPERANYTLLDGVRAVLVVSGLPAFLWGEALMYII
jgi:Integrase core domain